MVNKEIKSIGIFSTTYNRRIEEIALQCCEIIINKKIETSEDIKNAANELLKKGIKNVIITLGEKGIYFANGKKNFFLEAYKLKQPVIDTTGAGDAFNGAFAVGLANDLDIKEALSFANKVAGISTTRLGAASSMPFARELTDN